MCHNNLTENELMERKKQELWSGLFLITVKPTESTDLLQGLDHRPALLFSYGDLVKVSSTLVLFIAIWTMGAMMCERRQLSPGDVFWFCNLLWRSRLFREPVISWDFCLQGLKGNLCSFLTSGLINFLCLAMKQRPPFKLSASAWISVSRSCHSWKLISVVLEWRLKQRLLSQLSSLWAWILSKWCHWASAKL